MRHIEPLDATLATHIRSHLVINSVELVVRALLVNSVEANASNITMKIDLDTLSVCCEDDGEGILPEDLILLKRRHFSSKYSGPDAHHQGESLSSICECSSSVVINSMARNGDGSTEVLSCTGNPEEIGVVLRQFFQIDEKSRPGTVVMVSRVFSRNPVRFQLLRDSLNERDLHSALKSSIFDSVHAIGSVKLQLYFRRNQQFEMALNIDTTKGPRTLFQKLFGFSADSLVAVEGARGNMEIDGFISLRGSNCANLQFAFLNQHPIRFTKTQSANLAAILKKFGVLSTGRNGVLSKSVTRCPAYYFEISGSNYDDPTDDSLASIFDLVKESVSESLQKLGYTSRSATPSPRKARSTQTNYSLTVLPNLAKEVSDVSEVSILSLLNGNFGLVKQIMKLAILITIGTRLFAIDQHACDERIQLESLLQEFIGKVLDRLTDLRVKCPQEIHFSVLQESAKDLSVYSDSFRQFGISFVLRENTVTLTHLPIIMANLMELPILKECLLQYTVDLRDRKKSPTIKVGPESWFLAVKDLPSMILEALISQSCKLSVKFGDKLTEHEMKLLVIGLARCHLPLQCAHGRPTIVLLEDMHTQMPKLFDDDEWP